MPRLTGLQAAAELKRRRPEVRMLMLSMYDSEQYFFEALKAGASGYVLKSAADHDWSTPAARRCAASRSSTRLRGARWIRDYLDRAGRGSVPPDPLTPREPEIVKLGRRGPHRATRSPRTLQISEKTVERHRSNMLEKLGMRDRVALTRYAIRRGLVEP